MTRPIMLSLSRWSVALAIIGGVASTCNITESGDGESGSGGGMIDSSGCEDDDRDVVKAKEVCSKNLMVVVVAAVPVLVIILTVAALLTLVCVWKRQHRLRKSPLYLGSCRRLPISIADRVNPGQNCVARGIKAQACSRLHELQANRTVPVEMSKRSTVVEEGSFQNVTASGIIDARPMNIEDNTSKDRSETSFSSSGLPSRELSRTYTLPNAPIHHEPVADLTPTSSVPDTSVGYYFTPLPPTPEVEEKPTGEEKDTSVSLPIEIESGYMQLNPLIKEVEHHYETLVKARGEEGKREETNRLSQSGVTTGHLRNGRRKKPPPRLVSTKNGANRTKTTRAKSPIQSNHTSVIMETGQNTPPII